ncbi:D-alanine--D-alanine ligase family protein [Rhizobium mongolense]
MSEAQPTILFGGPSRERLVSVATTQALHAALPESDLWFWNTDNIVHVITPAELKDHTRAFEAPFEPAKPGFGDINQALDRAKAESRVMVFGLHGGPAENGELPLMCEMRGLAFTGAGSASGNIAFNKGSAKRFVSLAGLTVLPSVVIEEMEDALAKYGRLIAKPLRDGSSYGLIVVQSHQDIDAVRIAARAEDYIVEPFVSAVEATCGVLEQRDGTLIALPPMEIVAEKGVLDYTAKYLAETTQGICPGRFEPHVSDKIMEDAITAHRALSCSGYSRSDFIVMKNEVVFLELNTLPGLSGASAYPISLRVKGIPFGHFLQGQIALARRRRNPLV